METMSNIPEPDRRNSEPGREENLRKLLSRARRRYKAMVWAFCAMGFVCAVLSVGFLTLLDKANSNAEQAREAAGHAESAICIQIAYLEAVSRQSATLIQSDPDPDRQPARVLQLAVTNVLIGLLRAEVTSCPEMDAFERAVDDFESGKTPIPTLTPTPTPTPTP